MEQFPIAALITEYLYRCVAADQASDCMVLPAGPMRGVEAPSPPFPQVTILSERESTEKLYCFNLLSPPNG